MSDAYRTTERLDLRREREAALFLGMTMALVVVAALALAELAAAVGEREIMRARQAVLPVSTRIAIPVLVHLLSAGAAMFALNRAPRRPTVIVPIVASVVSIAATWATVDVSRSMVTRMDDGMLIAWSKDLEVVLSVGALVRPATIAVLILYCAWRWRRRARVAGAVTCPHCATALDVSDARP